MLITLTTDFGLSDSFVGQMKGVMLAIAPQAQLVDITHHVPPQNILAGALALEAVVDTFGRGAVHVGVVDPGVGTDRAAVAVETEHGFFVGPDNGLFTLVLQRSSFRRAVKLSNAAYHRPTVSATFHGRDIFAPVAAHLALGVDFIDLGEPISELVTLNISQPVELDDGGLELHILHTDHFGNLITDLTWDRWCVLQPNEVERAKARVTMESKKIGPIRRCFEEVAPGEWLTYFGSAGRLEIAVRGGRAAEPRRSLSASHLKIQMVG